MKSLFDWAFLGIEGKVWAMIAGALIVAGAVAIKITDNAVEDTIQTAQEAGAAKSVVRGHQKTLEQAEKANEAGDQVRDGRGNAVYDQCVRSASAATRANCEQFRN